MHPYSCWVNSHVGFRVRKAFWELEVRIRTPRIEQVSWVRHVTKRAVNRGIWSNSASRVALNNMFSTVT